MSSLPDRVLGPRRGRAETDLGPKAHARRHGPLPAGAFRSPYLDRSTRFRSFLDSGRRLSRPVPCRSLARPRGALASGARRAERVGRDPPTPLKKSIRFRALRFLARPRFRRAPEAGLQHPPSARGRSPQRGRSTSRSCAAAEGPDRICRDRPASRGHVGARAPLPAFASLAVRLEPPAGSGARHARRRTRGAPCPRSRSRTRSSSSTATR